MYKKYHEKVEGEQNREHFKRMNEQIQEVGGQLHFKLVTDEEGWFAKCEEFQGIVTGGSNSNPSVDEVSRAVIEAIKTAFHVPLGEIKEAEEKPVLNKVKLIRELQFA